MTKEIPLTRGKVALVDDEDFEELNKYKWLAQHSKNTWYARRYTKRINGKQGSMLMHRKLMGFPIGQIDHANQDGLDNRKINLRICSKSQNLVNSRRYKSNTSGFIGVSWNKQHKKWEANIRKDNILIHLGLFTEKIVAARMRDEKAKEIYGEFAVLNFPDE